MFLCWFGHRWRASISETWVVCIRCGHYRYQDVIVEVSLGTATGSAVPKWGEVPTTTAT